MPELDQPEQKTRLQQRKEKQQEAAKVRADGINEVRISFAKIKDEPAFLHLVAKLTEFANYHTKIAKDGVGYRDTGALDNSGNPVREIIYHDQATRLKELDKAAGQEEILAYIERQIAEENLEPVKAKKVVS